MSGKEETISFDKDDDDTLDFVTAAANLRSSAYGIPGKSRWEVKGTKLRQFWQVEKQI
jgi:ubiquitin-like 1-activating enzyme E1 B